MPLLKDTRKAAQRPQEGGVPEEQANAIVDLLVDADERVATKSDLDHVEQQIRSDVEAMEERITRKLTVRLFATAGLIAALLTIFEFAL